MLKTITVNLVPYNISLQGTVALTRIFLIWLKTVKINEIKSSRINSACQRLKWYSENSVFLPPVSILSTWVPQMKVVAEVIVLVVVVMVVVYCSLVSYLWIIIIKEQR